MQKLCQLEHNDLEKDSQVPKDTSENEIDKEDDKRDSKNNQNDKPKHGESNKDGFTGNNRRKY